MARRLLLLAIVGALAGVAAPAASQELVVILHPSRSDVLDREQVAQIYLRKRRFWRDGDAIVPINREVASSERALFERRVFRSFASQLPVFWNRAWFQGVLPPPTLASDEAVLRFVAGERRAIGYVAAEAVDAHVAVALRLEASDEPR